MTPNRRDRGFTLVELLVAAFVCVLVCGAALALIAKHVPAFNQQQNMAGLNIQLRNAVSQLQLDTINAGNGFYQGINIADFPLGLTIQNNTTTPCNTPSTFTYGPNCFDRLNIIAVDTTTPGSHPSDSIGTGCINTSAGTTIYTNPVSPTTNATLAGDFHSGDQLLLIKSSPLSITSVILTADAVVASGRVQLTFTPTAGNGTNNLDPAYITNNFDTPNETAPYLLGVHYCPSDWILKITPIIYKVDTSTAADPILIREVRSGITVTDTVVAEQVVGFKVGAITWNTCVPSCTSDDGSTYNYNSDTYADGNGAQAYNWSLIRSVQIELIMRTTPNPSLAYRNGFDGGPYQIQSVSVVVNPRNLTMNNN